MKLLPRLALFSTALALLATEPNDATRRWWAHIVALANDEVQAQIERLRGEEAHADRLLEDARFAAREIAGASLHEGELERLRERRGLLANAAKIGQLNVSPDLLQTLLEKPKPSETAHVRRQ